MRLHIFLLLLTTASYASPWPQFRGPEGKAVSDEANLPMNWSQADGVLWKVEVPKWSFSSPVVWGDHVFVTGALEENKLVVLAFNREDGKQLWRQEFTATAEALNLGPWNTAASPTPATDGKTLVCVFGGGDVIALDYAGSVKWKRSLAFDYGEINCQHGFASSPILWNDRALIVVDRNPLKSDKEKKPASYLLALNLETGKNIYKVTRDTQSSWGSPLLYTNNGKSELVTGSQAKVLTHDPETGKLLWEAVGLADYVAPSPAYGDGMVYVSSGRNGPTLALRPNGSGDVTATHIEWRKSRGGPYVVSPLYYRGYLYVLSELGIIECFEGKTGDRAWKQRIRGRFSACPVAADGKIYFLSEDGLTYILKPGADFEVLAENNLEGETGCMGTPAISQGNIFIRSDDHLICVGQSKGTVAAGNGDGSKVDPKALVELLRTSGYHDNDNGPYIAAVEKLAELKYAPAAEVFPHVIRKTHYDVSEVAVKGFSELGEAAIPGLLSLLEDRRDFIQWEAAAGLARLKSAEAVAPLRTLLAKGKPLVRLAAAEALDAIGGDAAIEGLVTSAKDEEGPVRQVAMDALGRHLGQNALPHLKEGLKDADRLVRIKAAEALGKIGGKDVADILTSAAKVEEDPGVKAKIEEAGK
ncbi:MAG: PQQ-binding-like beta-propeller repeat protein [Planctomycetota bacterium]|nr:PQQ-binding-like beta-propeller repeat protein [Planctomycetota bacterium]